MKKAYIHCLWKYAFFLCTTHSEDIVCPKVDFKDFFQQQFIFRWIDFLLEPYFLKINKDVDKSGGDCSKV